MADANDRRPERVVSLVALITVVSEADADEIRREIATTVQTVINNALYDAVGLGKLAPMVTYYYGSSVTGVDLTEQLQYARAEGAARPASAHENTERAAPHREESRGREA